MEPSRIYHLSTTSTRQGEFHKARIPHRRRPRFLIRPPVSLYSWQSLGNFMKVYVNRGLERGTVDFTYRGIQLEDFSTPSMVCIRRQPRLAESRIRILTLCAARYAAPHRQLEKTYSALRTFRNTRFTFDEPLPLIVNMSHLNT